MANEEDIAQFESIFSEVVEDYLGEVVSHLVATPAYFTDAMTVLRQEEEGEEVDRTYRFEKDIDKLLAGLSMPVEGTLDFGAASNLT